jgi:hypothetical protein
LAASALTPATTLPAGRSFARFDDISGFADPVRWENPRVSAQSPVESDPFRMPSSESVVASTPETPTVRSSSAIARGRVLSAILVADDRRVAVIDDEVVGTGDVLPDGARVSAIQPDRVFLVDNQGRWQTLTLTNRGQ